MRDSVVADFAKLPSKAKHVWYCDVGARFTLILWHVVDDAMPFNFVYNVNPFCLDYCVLHGRHRSSVLWIAWLRVLFTCIDLFMSWPTYSYTTFVGYEWLSYLLRSSNLVNVVTWLIFYTLLFGWQSDEFHWEWVQDSVHSMPSLIG